MELAGNQTLSILTEMLDEIVLRAVTAVSRGDDIVGSIATRRRGIRSQEHLAELIEGGKAAEAEAHWRSHMSIVEPGNARSRRRDGHRLAPPPGLNQPGLIHLSSGAVPSLRSAMILRCTSLEPP